MFDIPNEFFTDWKVCMKEDFQSFTISLVLEQVKETLTCLAFFPGYSNITSSWTRAVDMVTGIPMVTVTTWY
jgi:hypothetical protein